MALMQTLDHMEYPPFFYLCDRFEKSDGFFWIIQMLVTQVKELNLDHDFDYLYVHKQSGYSSIHWLAYNDDYKAIKWVLENQESEEKFDHKVLFTLMSRSKLKGLTPLCVAGTKRNKESLKVLIKYFEHQDCKNIIKELFKK
jgi:ankyrin repeat protein